MKAKHIEGKVQSLDVFNKRLDNLIAMRGSNSFYDEYVVKDDENGAKITFRTNGVFVLAKVVMTVTKAEHYYRYELPEKYRPIAQYEVYRNNNNAFSMYQGEDGQPPYIEGRIVRSGDPTENIVFSFSYATKEVTIAELEDARVGYDGTQYATAGTAIRKQIEALLGIVDVAQPRLGSVTLYSNMWEAEADGLHSQIVAIDGITEYSKVDLLPSVEQLAIFHNKDVAFVTENEDGVVTVFAIGDKPVIDYTMQISITEVTV